MKLQVDKSDYYKTFRLLVTIIKLLIGPKMEHDTQNLALNLLHLVLRICSWIFLNFYWIVRNYKNYK